MNEAIERKETNTSTIGLVTVVALIIGVFGAAFGIMAAGFSLRDGEISWVTLLTSVVCLVEACVVYFIEKSQSQR